MNSNQRQALDRLVRGNRRFAEGRTVHPRQDESVRATLKGGQQPFAAVVGCADSRVPIALVFDQGLGDLFTVRVAGNVATRVVIGSIEFAVAELGVDVVAVLGHEECGAVRAVSENVPFSSSMEVIAKEISPAVKEAQQRGKEVLDAAVCLNAINACEALVSRSDTLRSRVESGDLLVVPMVFRLDTGIVEQLRPA